MQFPANRNIQIHAIENCAMNGGGNNSPRLDSSHRGNNPAKNRSPWKQTPEKKESPKWKPFEVRPLASASSPTRKFQSNSPSSPEIRPIGKEDDLRDYISKLYEIELSEGRRANEELMAKYPSTPPAEEVSTPPPVKSPSAMRQPIDAGSSPSLTRYGKDMIVIPASSSPRKNMGSPSKVGASVDNSGFVWSPLSNSAALSSIRLGSTATIAHPLFGQALDDPMGPIPQKLPSDLSIAVDASMHGLGRFSLSVALPVVLGVLFRASLSLSHIHAHDEEGGLSSTEASLIEWLAKVTSRNYQNCVVGAKQIRIEPVPWVDFLPFQKSAFRIKIQGRFDHLFPYLSVLVPIFIFGKERMELAVEGPSDREGYPVLEHALALIPFLYAAAGAQIHIAHEKRSVQPQGQTVLVIQTRSLVKYLRPLLLDDRGNCVKVRVLGLVGHHAMRSTGHILIDRLREIFHERCLKFENKVEMEWGSQWVKADGLYFGVYMEMTCTTGMVVRSSLFRNAKGFHSPMQMAEEAFDALFHFLNTPYCVEGQAMAAALVIMALAKGRSRIRTEFPLSEEAMACVSYLECMTGVRFTMHRGSQLVPTDARYLDHQLEHVRLAWENTCIVECEGCGFENLFIS